MSVLALPLAIALAASGRLHGLVWLAAQIAAAPLLCVGLARLRGGATIFSLAAMMWCGTLMISGKRCHSRGIAPASPASFLSVSSRMP